MVEGPGATHNAVKAKKAVGMFVVSVDRSLPKLEASRHDIIGRRLSASFSVGKEVFLLFAAKDLEGQHLSPTNCNGEVALRLHFGMNGVLWCHRNSVTERPIPSWRAQQSKLRIVFAEEVTSNGERNETGIQCNDNCTVIIQTMDATVNFVSANIARSKYTRLHKLDCCNLDSDDSIGGTEKFDPKAVCDTIRQKRPNDLVSDAILNQDLFPGVGNIIKIEGLHQAKVHPQRIVSNLTENELRAVVDQCRRYAVQWYKTGHAGPKMVYNQNQCQTCYRGPVRMVKLGNDLSRVTFWCDSCQPQNPSLSASKSNSQQMQQQCRQPLRPVQYHEACPNHGTQSLKLKRVRKLDSGNALRLFRTCSVTNCSYFEWADTTFPHCRCKDPGGRVGARRTILRVSKTQKSGGRWFFSCARSSDPRKSASAGASAAKGGANYSSKVGGTSSSQQGCGFFEWASPAHLAPFGKALTPLL